MFVYIPPPPLLSPYLLPLENGLTSLAARQLQAREGDTSYTRVAAAAHGGDRASGGMTELMLTCEWTSNGRKDIRQRRHRPSHGAAPRRLFAGRRDSRPAGSPATSGHLAQGLPLVHTLPGPVSLLVPFPGVAVGDQDVHACADGR